VKLEILKLKPTFPATCQGTISGEASVTPTITKCKNFAITSTGRFNLAEECQFALATAGHPNCVIKFPARSGLNGVTYASAGSPKDIGITVAAGGASYSTNQCGLPNGVGTIRANLITKGFKPAGTMVSIEVK
jgi:hypothetical protein